MEDHYNDSVDRFFQERLQSSEEIPSKQTWDKIVQGLDVADANSKSVSYKYRLALIAVLTGILMFFNIRLADYLVPRNPTHAVISESYVLADKIHSNRVGLSMKQKNWNLATKNELIIRSVLSNNDPLFTKNTIFPCLENTDTKFDWDMVTLLNPAIPPLMETGMKYKNLISHSPANKQEELVRPNISTHRFSIEPYFYKEFVGYNFADDDITGANGREIEQRERTMFSASFGVYVNYRIHARLMLQSGLGYSWSKSNINSSTTFAMPGENGTVQFKLNTVSGYSYLHPPSAGQPALGDSLFTAGTYSHLRYLTIPLIISYKIPIKRLSLWLGAGSTFNILSDAELETDVYDANLSLHETKIPLKGLKQINFGLIVKAEMSYPISSKWSSNLILNFKNALGPINIHSALSAYPYNFGVGIGLIYRL